MPKINSEILKWARETAGLTLTDATSKLKLKSARSVSAVDRLAAYESGDESPTRPMLVKMAKQYRRPLLTFYMSKPPRPSDRGHDFRTLPTDFDIADDALLLALIRDVQIRQGIVRAVLENEDEATVLPFIGSMNVGDGVTSVISSITETLSIDLADFRSRKSADKAFSYLRDKAESVGIFVLLRGNLGSYHTEIDLETFRGYAEADPIAPFVVINEYDSRAAWSFTLLHELSHLWLGQTGVSGERAESPIEQFCNDVAGEILLPSAEAEGLSITQDDDIAKTANAISRFADERNVSDSMVAYKLRRVGSINQKTWQEISTIFRNYFLANRAKQRERAREKKPKIDSNVVRRHRNGNGLTELVSRMMDAGALTTSKAGLVLGVRGVRVQALLDAGRHGGVRRTA